MKIIVMSIRDRAIDSFSRPVYVQAIGQAVRSFQDEINNPQSEMSKHPEDYDLYHVGAFDDETGKFYNVEPQAKMVTSGKSCLLPKGDK